MGVEKGVGGELGEGKGGNGEGLGGCGCSRGGCHDHCGRAIVRLFGATCDVLVLIVLCRS